MKFLFIISTLLALAMSMPSGVIAGEDAKGRNGSEKHGATSPNMMLPVWHEIATDDGEFSVAAPKKYVYVENTQGFHVNIPGRSYLVESIGLYSSYEDHSLLSFEIYATKHSQSIGKILRESEIGKKSKLEIGGWKAHKIVRSSDGKYSVRLYIATKKRLYLLTAASRKGSTGEIKRFLDSLAVTNQGGKNGAGLSLNIEKKTPLSALRKSPIMVNLKYEPKKNEAVRKSDSMPKRPDGETTPVWVLSKPRPFFTPLARQNGEQGEVMFRVTLNRDGQITEIDVLKSLKDGLLRQAIFAVIRLRFVPSERNGVPYAVTKRIQYKYTIY